MLKTINYIRLHPINKNQQCKAIMRFLWWQLKSRIKPGFHKLPFGEKSKILAKKGLTGATGNIYCGLHEFNDMAFLLHFLREGDLFLDIGANIGSYTILSASEVGAQTISFEPIPATFNILEENIKVNQIEHLVELKNNGVGSENGVIRFTSGLDTVNHVASASDKDTVEVNVVTIDSEVQITKPCLIKIDVEGFETEVINGMTNTLKTENVKAIIIELNGSGNRYGYDESQIKQKLVDYGFESYAYAPFERKIEHANDLETDNFIFIRDLEFVQKRITQSRVFTIYGVEI